MCAVHRLAARVVLTLVAVLGEAQIYKVLYKFKGKPGGGNPYFGGLILDASGYLYGTTVGGRRFRRRDCVQAGYERQRDRALI